MSLKKETLQRIAVLTKVKVEDLEAAIKDDKEVDVAIDEKLTVMSETEVTTLKTNEYNSGKSKGVEMAVKETKEKLELDFQGKTIDGLIEAHKKKVLDEAKINPEKKVTDLEQKVLTLQKTITEQEKTIAEKETEVTGVKINGELMKHIPSFGEEGPALGSDDVIAMMNRNGYEFKLENGKVVPYKDGKQLQDKLSNPREAKEVVSDFLKQKKFITDDKTPAGRGSGDKRPASKAGTLTELKDKFKAEGKSLLGSEFSAAVEAAAKENKDFDMTK